MGLFTRREPAENDHRARIAALETEVKRLRLEWDDVLDKVFHRLARLQKRERDALGVSPSAPTVTDATPAALSRAEERAALRRRYASIALLHRNGGS